MFSGRGFQKEKKEDSYVMHKGEMIEGILILLCRG